jgi:hypothetical protein
MDNVVLSTSHHCTPAERREFRQLCSQWEVTPQWLNANTCVLVGPKDALETLAHLWRIAHRPMPHGVPQA